MRRPQLSFFPIFLPLSTRTIIYPSQSNLHKKKSAIQFGQWNLTRPLGQMTSQSIFIASAGTPLKWISWEWKNPFNRKPRWVEALTPPFLHWSPKKWIRAPLKDSGQSPFVTHPIIYWQNYWQIKSNLSLGKSSLLAREASSKGDIS